MDFDTPENVLSDYLDEWNATGKKPSKLDYLRRLPISEWQDAIDSMKLTDWLKTPAVREIVFGRR